LREGVLVAVQPGAVGTHWSRVTQPGPE
jgi:hypothetical protein